MLWPDSSEHHGNQVKSEKRKKREGCWTGVHGVLECVIHSALFWVLSCRKQKHLYIPVWAKGSLYIEFWTVCYMWATGCNSNRKRGIGVFLNTHHHPPLPTPPHHQHRSHTLPRPIPCSLPAAPSQSSELLGSGLFNTSFLRLPGAKKWLLPFCKWKVTSAPAKKAIPLTSLLVWANKKFVESYQG